MKRSLGTFVRRLLLAFSVAGCGLLVVIAAPWSSGFSGLERLREITWGIHAVLLLVALTYARDGTGLRLQVERVIAFVASRRFAVLAALTFLLLFVLSAVNKHVSFYTSTHDFSMIDSALYESHRGRLLFSQVLGRSFLSEHFSPILLLLVPLHAIFSSPWLLVFLQPLALWSAGLVLRKILRRAEVSAPVANFAMVIYWSHPITTSTLEYLFHMESLLPLLLFGAFWFYRARKVWAYGLLLFLLLAVKEDMGLYVAGFGLSVFLFDGLLGERHTRRLSWGLWTTAVAVVWTVASLQWMQQWAEPGQTYKFLQRWQAWGETWWQVPIGYLQMPLDFVASLVREPIPRYLACLGFLPFLAPRTLGYLAVPWILNATSGNEQQASMSLYYGMPLLAFASLSAVRAMQTHRFQKLAQAPVAAFVAWLIFMLNFSHLTFKEVPSDRGEFMQQLERLPAEAQLQASSSIVPHLPYTADVSLLRPGDAAEAEFVLLRRRDNVWPLQANEVENLRARALAGGYRAIYESEEFSILHETTAQGGF